MAPTVRASTVNSAGSLTINVPTNVNGDMLIWFVTTTVTISTPTGWHLITSVVITGNTTIYAFSRVAASEPGSYTATGANVPGQVMASVQNAASILNLDASGTANGSSTSPQQPALAGLSTSTDLLLGGYEYGLNGGASVTFTKPAAMTLVNDSLYQSGTALGCAMASLALASNSSVAETASTNNTSEWGAISLAIAPPPSFALPILHGRRRMGISHIRPKHTLRFRPLWKLPLSPHPDFPQQLRHQQQRHRVPIIKAKKPVKQRWIVERQVTAPHADFPQQLRHQQQRHRIPKVKTTKPLRTRWINERLVTAPHADFPPILRHRQQKYRIPVVRRTKLNKNKIELTIPQAPPQVAPTPIFARKQRRRLPAVKAKKPVRNRLINARLVTAPYDFPEILRHKQQNKRLSKVKAKRVVRSNIELRIPQAPPQVAPAPIFARKQRRRLPKVRAKAPVRNRLLDQRLVTAPYDFPEILRRQQQKKKIPKQRAKRQAISNIQLRIPQAPVIQPAIFPPAVRRGQRRRALSKQRAKRQSFNSIELKIPQPQFARQPVPLPIAIRHRQRKRLPFMGKRASVMMIMGRAPAVVVGTVAIVVWRHRAGMQ